MRIIGWCAIHGAYSDYTPENRTQIGEGQTKYNTNSGPARATRHFAVPEMLKQQREGSRKIHMMALLCDVILPETLILPN